MADEEKKQNRKKPFAYWWLIATPIVIALGFLFILLGTQIYDSLKGSQEYKNNFVVIYSSITGGFCTLLGVVMTLHSEDAFSINKQIEKNKPEFYMPNDSFNFYGSEKFYLLQVGQKKKSKKTPLPDIRLRFKNTDKAAFKIGRVFCDDLKYNGRDIFIEKNKYFSITLDLSKKKTVKKMVITVIALDNYYYPYEIDEKNKTVTIIENKKDRKKYVNF